MYNEEFREHRSTATVLRLAMLVCVVVVVCLTLPGAASAAAPSCEVDPGKPGNQTTGLTNVSVAATDPSNTINGKNPQAPYCVGDPDPGTSNGKLVVFLPGSTAVAPYYTEFLVQAKHLGYHVIGLSYPNGGTTESPANILEVTTQVSICGSHVGAANGTHDCFHELAQNRLDGTPEPDGKEWNDPYASLIGKPNEVANPYPGVNSIEYRLRLLLGHLSQADSSGGWGSFITGKAPWWGAPQWGNIVFSGHSQGGGEAAYVGKVHALAGVVMFAAPDDATETLVLRGCNNPIIAWSTTTAAQWLEERPFQTSLSRYYELGACYDLVWPYTVTGMTALGAFSEGNPTSVDNSSNAEIEPSAPAPGGTHWFTSMAKPTGYSATTLSYYNHDMPVVDGYTPWCAAPYSSTPFLTTAWDQLLLWASGSSQSAPYAGCKRAHLDEAPGVSAVSPNSGSTSGGTKVTITGKYFTGASTVTVGGTAVSSFTVNTDSEITATTATHAAGTVDVRVITPGGTSPVAAGDKYTYR